MGCAPSSTTGTPSTSGCSSLPSTRLTGATTTTWVLSPPPGRSSRAVATPVTAATVPSPLLTASTVPTGTASPTGPSASPPATRSAFALLTPSAYGAATTLDTVPTN